MKLKNLVMPIVWVFTPVSSCFRDYVNIEIACIVNVLKRLDMREAQKIRFCVKTI